MFVGGGGGMLNLAAYGYQCKETEHVLHDITAQCWFLESVSSLQIVDHFMVGQCWVGQSPETEHFPAHNSIRPLSISE